MRFGLFYLAEYLHTLIVSAVAAAIFFGGWDLYGFAPGLHWMVLKTLLLFATIFWIRWSLVRFRADQLMRLCWRWLVPGTLLLLLLASLVVHLRFGGPPPAEGGAG